MTATWAPSFGDLVENTVASLSNPRRIGRFVRAVRIPRGRINSGLWWEITDGRGHFWQSNPDHCWPPIESPAWNARAAALLAELVEHGDDNGALANTRADELRDALRLAVERLRDTDEPNPYVVHQAATAVLVAGWSAVQRGAVDARSVLGDALLSLRDALNPTWPSNPDWLPT